jgi:hypothetical protein
MTGKHGSALKLYVLSRGRYLVLLPLFRQLYGGESSVAQHTEQVPVGPYSGCLFVHRLALDLRSRGDRCPAATLGGSMPAASRNGIDRASSKSVKVRGGSLKRHAPTRATTVRKTRLASPLKAVPMGPACAGSSCAAPAPRGGDHALVLPPHPRRPCGVPCPLRLVLVDSDGLTHRVPAWSRSHVQNVQPLQLLLQLGA